MTEENKELIKAFVTVGLFCIFILSILIFFFSASYGGLAFIKKYNDCRMDKYVCLIECNDKKCEHTCQYYYKICVWD